MSVSNPTYDLMLLLDPALTEEQSTKILGDSEAMITKDGEVTYKQDYGLRPTTFEIKKKGEATYHLIQFHGSADVLATLDRNLRITDGVLRHRIIKLAPGTPAAPDLRAKAAAPEAPAAPPRQTYELSGEEAEAAAAYSAE